MPDSAVVTSIADGSARTFEWRQLPNHNPGGTTAGNDRGGLFPPGSVFPSATNWGLSGEAPAQISYRDMYFQRQEGGASQFGPRFPWVSTQQPLNRFAWRQGLYVLQGVLAWPTDTVAVDNGIFVSNNTFNRVVQQATAGFGIWNDNGVCKFTMQGAVRTDIVLNNSPGGIREPMKFRMEIRSATKDIPASVVCIINDTQQALFKGSALPVNNNINAWMTYIGVLSNTSYIYYRDLHFFCGPDTTLGV
jgi:hypothetical protein